MLKIKVIDSDLGNAASEDIYFSSAEHQYKLSFENRKLKSFFDICDSNFTQIEAYDEEYTILLTILGNGVPFNILRINNRAILEVKLDDIRVYQNDNVENVIGSVKVSNKGKLNNLFFDEERCKMVTKECLLYEYVLHMTTISFDIKKNASEYSWEWKLVGHKNNVLHQDDEG
jgi:hypothetical protein